MNTTSCLSIHNVEFWKALVIMPERLGRELSVHLKVDTGMGRLGLTEDEAERMLRSSPPASASMA